MATSSLTGTGNQPYTTARVDYLAKYMQAQLPGLDYNVAVRWINAEQGVNGNVLGVTYLDTTTNKRRLRTYASQEAGIRAAVSLLKSSSNYTSILAALGGSYTTQARAITASPWHRRNSTYYARIFGITTPNAVRPGAITAAVSGTPTMTTTAADATPEAFAAFQKRLAEIGISTDPSHKITQAESDLIATELYGVDPRLFGDNLVGKTVRELAAGGSINFDPVGAAGDVIRTTGDALAFLFDTENWKYFAAIIAGVPLVLLGFYLLAGVKTGGE